MVCALFPLEYHGLRIIPSGVLISFSTQLLSETLKFGINFQQCTTMHPCIKLVFTKKTCVSDRLLHIIDCLFSNAVLLHYNF